MEKPTARIGGDEKPSDDKFTDGGSDSAATLIFGSQVRSKTGGVMVPLLLIERGEWRFVIDPKSSATSTAKRCRKRGRVKFINPFAVR